MNNIKLHIIGSETFSILLDELNINYTIISDKKFKYNNQDPLVRVIFVEQLQLVEIKKYFSENIPTIFLLKNKDFLKKYKFNLLQFHLYLFDNHDQSTYLMLFTQFTKIFHQSLCFLSCLNSHKDQNNYEVF
jgi:hypothetical protein